MKRLFYAVLLASLTWPGADATAAVAHGDHGARYGGEFFMAGDGVHHLEGVLTDHEFRLYFYDSKTQPVSAERFAGATEILLEGLNADGLPNGNVRRLRLEVGAERTFLAASLPFGWREPPYVTVRVRLQDGKSPELFNFGAARHE